MYLYQRNLLLIVYFSPHFFSFFSKFPHFSTKSAVHVHFRTPIDDRSPRYFGSRAGIKPAPPRRPQSKPDENSRPFKSSPSIICPPADRAACKPPLEIRNAPTFPN